MVAELIVDRSIPGKAFHDGGNIVAIGCLEILFHHFG
jgi:hypothetical protein